MRRLDATHLVALVNAHTGAGLTLLGPALGGQVGAGFVRWPDGRDGVLTIAPPGSADEMQRIAGVLRIAHDRGVPAPAYELIAEVPDAVAVVQERLPGAPPRRADRGVVEAMVALTELFAGLLADRPDLRPPNLHLRSSGPGFSLHESLARYDDRTRRLLAWVHEVGTDRSAVMSGDDLVHMDFHPGNVLVDDAGAITGVVDWDGAGRGDRRFALVTLRFGIAGPDADRATAAWLDEVLDQRVEEDKLRAYWASMSLRMVDWAIRHFSAVDVDATLELAETRIN